MQISKFFFIAAQVLPVPAVSAMQDKIREIIKGESGDTVHEIPHNEVNGYLLPLLEEGGEKFVMELIDRSAASPKRAHITSALGALKKPELTSTVVKEILEFTHGSLIEDLDLDTIDDDGTPLVVAVS